MLRAVTVRLSSRIAMGTVGEAELGPVALKVKEKLTGRFQPSHLELINESFMHSVPKGSESHFRVLMASKEFTDVPLLQRHRMVNEVLAEELSTCIHALSLQLKTPEEFEQSDKTPGKSPPCMGGNKH